MRTAGPILFFAVISVAVFAIGWAMGRARRRRVPAQDAGLLGVLGKVRVRTPAQLARRRCKLDYRDCVSEASRTFDSPCPTLACTRAAERIYTTDIARCDRVLQSCVAPWPTVCLYRMASGGCAFDDSTWDLDE